MKKNYILINHFYELKYRLIYIVLSIVINFVVFYFFLGELTYLIIKPLTQDINLKVQELIYTDMSEAFFASIKLSFYSAIFITIPIFLYHIYFFFLPGMYKYEKKTILKYINLSLILIIISFNCAYIFFIPLIWNFFLNYDFNIDNTLFIISFDGKIIEYIDLIINILVGFILCFQVPLLFFILLKLKILTNKELIKYRSLNIILCFILGACFSPPDVISQILLAIPLCIIYEINIFFSLFLSNQKGYLENT